MESFKGGAGVNKRIIINHLENVEDENLAIRQSAVAVKHFRNLSNPEGTIRVDWQPKSVAVVYSNSKNTCVYDFGRE